jgi:hypothetical protein
MRPERVRKSNDRPRDLPAATGLVLAVSVRRQPAGRTDVHMQGEGAMTSHEEKRREIGWDIEIPDDAPPDLREALAEIRHAHRPPRGFRWIDRWFERRAVHTNWMSRAKVDGDPAKVRSLRRSIALRVVLGVACWLGLVFDEWIRDVLPFGYLAASLIFGVSLAAFMLWSIGEAINYKRGWIDGRDAMRSSAVEARMRGMSIGEWWERERHRDRGIL